MSQPPNSDPAGGFPPPPNPPQWRRPPGVAPGTWDYVNERSIADRYDDFVADTPLCRLDSQILHDQFPPLSHSLRAGPTASEPAGRSVVVLDLGCGSGRAAVDLAGRGYHVVAIDLSIPMLRVTVGKALAQPTLGRVYPLRANLVQLECLSDHSADHAICLFSTLGMIQGRGNRRSMLRQVARIVAAPPTPTSDIDNSREPEFPLQRGSLVLHVHSKWAALAEPGGFRRLAASWWRSVREPESEFGDAVYAYRGLENMFMHRFSRREIVQDLRASGWSIQRVLPITIDGSRIGTAGKIRGGYLIIANTL